MWFHIWPDVIAKITVCWQQQQQNSQSQAETSNSHTALLPVTSGLNHGLKTKSFGIGLQHKAYTKLQNMINHFITYTRQKIMSSNMPTLVRPYSLKNYNSASDVRAWSLL